MKNIGQIAYDAYCQSSDGRSLISGDLLPPWDKLQPKIKAAWDTAGQAVARHCMGEPGEFVVRRRPKPKRPRAG